MRVWAILFGVYAAVAQTAVAQNEPILKSTDRALARRAEYGLRWHRFWDSGGRARSAPQTLEETAVAFLVDERWVVILRDSRVAISMRAEGDGNVVGPIIEVGESIVYGSSPDQALDFYLSLHAPQNTIGCFGVVAEVGPNHPKEGNNEPQTLPLARPCTASIPWTVRATRQIAISSELNWVRPPPPTNRTRIELTTLVRSWTRTDLPGLSGTMVVPSVFADVDPRIYVYLSGNGIEGILILQREEKGQMTVYKLLERPESVTHYLGRIDLNSPFKMPW